MAHSDVTQRMTGVLDDGPNSNLEVKQIKKKSISSWQQDDNDMNWNYRQDMWRGVIATRFQAPYPLEKFRVNRPIGEV